MGCLMLNNSVMGVEMTDMAADFSRDEEERNLMKQWTGTYDGDGFYEPNSKASLTAWSSGSALQ
jgi:hypothetical protein